ncbi:MAG: hypothetical protein JWM05_2957 [Acidimicrobiales bacterium]|nr:hypothetical protein [Acidimicrobiales bacterium]
MQLPPTTTADDAAARRVCGWLDHALIQQVIGAAVTATRAGTDGAGGQRCTFLLGDKVDAVVLVSYPSGGRDLFEATRTVGRRAPEPVPGLGDDAYWQPDLRNLAVLTGDRSYLVQLATARPVPDPKAKAERLARAAPAHAR